MPNPFSNINVGQSLAARNAYVAALNAAQARVQNPFEGAQATTSTMQPSVWGAAPSSGAIPIFGDGGLAVQKEKNAGLLAAQAALHRESFAKPKGVNWDIMGHAIDPTQPSEFEKKFAAQHYTGPVYNPNAGSNVFAGLRGELPAQADPRLQYYLSHWQPPTHPMPSDRNAWSPTIDYRQMQSLPVGPMKAVPETPATPAWPSYVPSFNMHSWVPSYSVGQQAV